jgi:hypothetical protein
VHEPAAQLQFAMTDLNKPSFHHGGGTVDYRGQAEVPWGAFAKGFIGPSPPPGDIHTYEFTVKSLARMARRWRRRPCGANFRNSSAQLELIV